MFAPSAGLIHDRTTCGRDTLPERDFAVNMEQTAPRAAIETNMSYPIPAGDALVLRNHRHGFAQASVAER